jgi:hypothetical protein
LRDRMRHQPGYADRGRQQRRQAETRRRMKPRYARTVS